MNIPIYKPYLPKKSLSYAYEALDSTWISSQGKYINLAQEKLQDLLNIKYVLLLNNGTSACHLVAKCLSKYHNKNKIIVPNNVYAAAWNAFLFDSNYDVISIDADVDTWNFDLKELDIAITTHPDAAVLVVHNIGNIINVPELQKKYPNTIFVEDNCEGFLGKYNGIQSGTASYVSSISFFGNKNITSGEGGALITNDEATYNFAKCVQGQGQSNKRFIHNELGYNYRMTNIQAAILLGQLEILPQILNMKEDIFNRYRKFLQNRQDILTQSIQTNTEHSNWMFGVRVIGNPNYESAELFFKKNNIEIRPMFYSIADHPYMIKNSNVLISNCISANILNKECFILPSYPELTESEQDYILKILNEYIISLK